MLHALPPPNQPSTSPARRAARGLIPLLALGLTCQLSADVSVSPLFGDHAVLQAGKNTAVWGTASEGEKVTVRLGEAEASSVAKGGRWLVHLPALTANATGRDLLISGSNNIVSHDVLVGDVWLAAGQSNMERRLDLANHQPPIDNYLEEAATANIPTIRFFNVPNTPLKDPTLELKGSWQVLSPTTVMSCSAVGFFFARALHEAGKGPLGLVINAAGGTTAQSWISRDALLAVPELAGIAKAWDADVVAYPELFARWKTEADAAKAAGQPAPAGLTMRDPIGHYLAPISRYNGMVHPLIPLSLRGVIWYQGESNTGKPLEYPLLMQTLAAEWRAKFDAPELPFLMVMVAPYIKSSPEMREAQMRAAKLVPQADMISTLDAGDAGDIHPPHKRPVGERLALLARHHVYGESDLVSSGPRFAGATFVDGKATVRFTELGGGLATQGDILKGFTLAGADGKFIPAEARIEGDTVVVSAPGLTTPTAVRYGWASVPEATLANRAGLPAFPFRSDGTP